MMRRVGALPSASTRGRWCSTRRWRPSPRKVREPHSPLSSCALPGARRVPPTGLVACVVERWKEKVAWGSQLPFVSGHVCVRSRDIEQMGWGRQGRAGRGSWDRSPPRGVATPCASSRCRARAVREECKEVDKAYDKTEDDLKALQSVGQVSHAPPPLPPPPRFFPPCDAYRARPHLQSRQPPTSRGMCRVLTLAGALLDHWRGAAETRR
eukprot:COSAG01_NODE_249_length_20357_cov_3.458171_16_plen_210_part_00